jgi:hypothetical protein
MKRSPFKPSTITIKSNDLMRITAMDRAEIGGDA